MTGEQMGAIACTGGCGFLAVQMVRSFNGFSTMLPALAVGAVFLAGILVLCARRTPTPAQWSAAKAAQFKSSEKGIPTRWKNGLRRHIAVHEAGHHGVGTALGKRCKSYIFDGNEGGFCSIPSWWRDPRDNIAFLLAGGMAARSQQGCSSDNQMIRGFLRQVPAEQRDEAMRTARQRAQWGLNTSSGLRARVAHVLFERGWFW